MAGHRLERTLAAVERPPTRVWPWGVVHHGVRVLLLVGIALAVYFLFPLASVPDFPVMEKGMVADEDVIAQVAFSIRKSDAELFREREDAASGVAAIYRHDPEAVDTMLARVEGFFERIESALAASESEPLTRRAIQDILASYGFSVDAPAVDAVIEDASRRRVRAGLEAAIRQEIPAGVVRPADLDEGPGRQARLARDDGERSVDRDSLVTSSTFYSRVPGYLPSAATSAEAELARLVAIRFFEPSVRFDPVSTEAARSRARQAVSPVKGQVLAGERIVTAHELVGDREIEKLRSYQDRLAELDRLEAGGAGARGAGAVLFNLFVLSLFGLLLFFFRRGVYDNLRHLLLVALLAVALCGVAAVIGRSGAPMELIPIAFPTLVIAALWDGRMALNFALILAILLAGQAPFLGISALFTLVMGGAAAALAVRVVRRRAQWWAFSVIIAGAYVAAAVTIGLLRAQGGMDIGVSMGWGTLNAVASALLAMGFLPLVESFTRITTDQTLLELADLNRPLLKRLAHEAPGTYAHSINVANLAEAAARGIDANALLTRVGVYYHDVGKMVKPQYFIENQPQGRNPHDKLKPATSAGVVRNHVVEGIRLAEEAKLPDSVRAFIAEHHGTQPISFFFERAQELDPGADLNAKDFAYLGPRPQSKETAIVMLADSVESASRVLPDPTPERIRDLVDRIVDGKLAQGQLDEAPLTLRDLTRIKEEFVAILSGMYHHRIDYPTMPQAAGNEPPAAGEAVAGASRPAEV